MSFPEEQFTEELRSNGGEIGEEAAQQILSEAENFFRIVQLGQRRTPRHILENSEQRRLV